MALSSFALVEKLIVNCKLIFVRIKRFLWALQKCNFDSQILFAD